MRFRKYVEGRYHSDNSDVTKVLPKDEYGKKIRNYRKQRHLTQGKLATKIGCNQITISQIENGVLTYNHSQELTQSLNKFFGINIAPVKKVDNRIVTVKRNIVPPSFSPRNSESKPILSLKDKDTRVDYLPTKEQKPVNLATELEKISSALNNISKLIKQ